MISTMTNDMKSANTISAIRTKCGLISFVNGNNKKNKKKQTHKNERELTAIRKSHYILMTFIQNHILVCDGVICVYVCSFPPRIIH